MTRTKVSFFNITCNYRMVCAYIYWLVQTNLYWVIILCLYWAHKDLLVSLLLRPTNCLLFIFLHMLRTSSIVSRMIHILAGVLSHLLQNSSFRHTRKTGKVSVVASNIAFLLLLSASPLIRGCHSKLISLDWFGTCFTPDALPDGLGTGTRNTLAHAPPVAGRSHSHLGTISRHQLT